MLRLPEFAPPVFATALRERPVPNQLPYVNHIVGGAARECLRRATGSASISPSRICGFARLVQCRAQPFRFCQITVAMANLVVVRREPGLLDLTMSARFALCGR